MVSCVSCCVLVNAPNQISNQLLLTQKHAPNPARWYRYIIMVCKRTDHNGAEFSILFIATKTGSSGKKMPMWSYVYIPQR